MNFYLEGLTDHQREAVLHDGHPLLVLAGAGSGKTRVITRRIARLILEGFARPHEILALTFTNKAAGEMRDRSLRLLATEERDLDERTRVARGEPKKDFASTNHELWISTFHSICARILRFDGRAVGIEPDFMIYDTSDSLAVVTTVAGELGIKRDLYAPRLLLSVIRKAKSEGFGPEQFDGQDFGLDAKVREVYPAYKARLQVSGAVEFDDLLYMVNRLFEEDTEILNVYRKRFRQILVDEYQDTNGAQHRLLKLLAGEGEGLCVVGDEDQSIYNWRGADVRGILQMEQDYPGTRVIQLEENFRSSAAILRGAAEVIKQNRNRRSKNLIPTREVGEKLTLYSAMNERAEAEYVASKVAEFRKAPDKPCKRNSMAVFFRTHTQSRQFEEAFRRHRIPHQVVAGLRFFDRKEIKDIVSYFKFLVNPKAEEALLRIINVPPRGIGNSTVKQLKEAAREANQALWEVIGSREVAIKGAPGKRVAEFHQLMVQLAEEAAHLPVMDLFRSLLARTKYEDLCRAGILREFENSLEEFQARWDSDAAPKLRDYLDETALLAEIDVVGDEYHGETLLMTLHAAKGLEFDTVFLTGVEEGLIPHDQSLRNSGGDIEEERRLFYVGMTRAENRLILTRALTRTLHGQTRTNPESIFLTEIPEDVLTREGGGSELTEAAAPLAGWQKNRRYGKRQIGLADGPFSSQVDLKAQGSLVGRWKVGTRIIHDIFGSGTILGSKGSGDNLCLSVRFATGTKKLMIKYAPIRIVK